MNFRILLSLLSILAIFNYGQADEDIDQIMEIIQGIRQISPDVQDNFSETDLAEAVLQVAARVRDVVRSSGVEITEEKEQIVLDQLRELLETDAEDEVSNPLASGIESLGRALVVLNKVADDMEASVQSQSAEDVLENLIAAEAVTLLIADDVAQIDSVIEAANEFQGGDDGR